MWAKWSGISRVLLVDWPNWRKRRWDGDDPTLENQHKSTLAKIAVATLTLSNSLDLSEDLIWSSHLIFHTFSANEYSFFAFSKNYVAYFKWNWHVKRMMMMIFTLKKYPYKIVSMFIELNNDNLIIWARGCAINGNCLNKHQIQNCWYVFL